MRPDKIKAIKTARKWMDQKPIFFDTETTGLSGEDEIIELALIDFDGAELMDTLIKPTIPITKEASNIHGIDDAAVKDAPRLGQIMAEFSRLAEGRPVVIYNADFDTRVLRQSLTANDLPIIRVQGECAMKLYAQYYGEWNDYRHNYRWQSLSNAAEQLGIGTDEDTHRAAADAKLCRLVVKAMAETPIPGETVLCRICETPTPMLGTKLCDRCYELESRIRADPKLAKKILSQLP